MTEPVEDRFICDREVARLAGVSRSVPWKWAAAGVFPRPVRLSARCTRWRLSEVHQWMADPDAWQAGHV